MAGQFGPTSVLTSSLLGTAAGMTAYAQGQVGAATAFVATIAQSIAGLQPPVVNAIFPGGGSAPSLSIPSAPSFGVPIWNSPGFPAALTAVLDVGDLGIEPFDKDPPLLMFGTAPDAFSGVMPDAPAINLDFVDPTLVVNLPSVPQLLTLDIQPFDGINLPTFDADDPVLVAVEPSVREYVPGDRYTSDLLTGLESTLLDRITSGGTGLTQEVENAIWDRGREREFRSQSDALAQVEQMESLGYALPAGIYLDARLKVMTESDYVNRGLNRDIIVQSSNLMLDNIKSAITAAVQLETEQLTYNNAVEQRLFDATKYATEAGISIYNAKVTTFAAMVEVYKTKIQIYTAQIQAEVSKVEAYKAQIQAEEAKAQVNTALVNQYSVQVQAALANVEIYKAEITGIQTKAQIEQTKVSVFGEQVRGYTAQINAYTAGVEGFRASISAEATKQDAYKSQVDAFAANVNATVGIIDARVRAYEGLIAAKTAEYDGYKAAVAGESARVDAISKISGITADVYRSQVTGITGYNEVLTKQWQATLDQNQRTAEIGIQASKANADLYISTRSLALDAAKTAATVSAQIGSAALNAVNFSGSVSSSEGYNASESASSSIGTNTSNSTSTSTNYNYSV